jgi:hypothetical protein
MMGEKGLKEEDLTDRRNLRRKITSMRNGRREDVETLYNLLNNKNACLNV